MCNGGEKSSKIREYFMKRLIGMVAAMALLTSSAAYAQNTAVEIHQYFWAPGTAPGATPNITATPGSDVTLTVYLRALQGNGTGQLGITQYAYEIGGQGG